jgi:hypothetical protein
MSTPLVFLFTLLAGGAVMASPPPSLMGTAAFEQMAIEGHIRRIRMALESSGAMDADHLIRSLREATSQMRPADARRFLESMDRSLGQAPHGRAVGGSGPAKPRRPSQGLDSPRGVESAKGLDPARGLGGSR